MSEYPLEYFTLIEDLNIIKKSHAMAVAVALKEGRKPELCMIVRIYLLEINTICNTIEEYISNNSRNY
jgi:hypothetical protein